MYNIFILYNYYIIFINYCGKITKELGENNKIRCKRDFHEINISCQFISKKKGY